MPKHPLSRAKLDKKLVDSIPNTTAGQRVIWDAEVKGFGLLVGKRGKSFFVQREIRIDGKRRCRRQTLGRYGLDVTVAQARDKALEQIVRFKKRLDLDPKAEAARQAAVAKTEREQGITLRGAWALYQREGEKKGHAKNTKDRYQQIIDTYFADWMDKPLRDITRAVVRKRHDDLATDVAAGRFGKVVAGHKAGKKARREGKAAGHKLTPHNRSGVATANNSIRLFRAIYNVARDDQPSLPENPCNKLTWFTEKPRRTIIPKKDLRAWYQGTERIPNPVRRDLLRFMLFSGLRRRSASEVRVSDVDFEGATLLVRRPKGGEERAFVLPLSDHLVALLKQRCEDNAALAAQGMVPSDSPYVFPASSKSGHVEEPREPIAGFDYSPHSLRRTFITIAESLDISPYAIKALVNHLVSDQPPHLVNDQQPRGDVTAGYINITVERLRAPMQKITDFLLATVQGGPGNVVPLQPRKKA